MIITLPFQASWLALEKNMYTKMEAIRAKVEIFTAIAAPLNKFKVK